MAVRPLAGSDACILDKLAQVVAITRRNGWGSAADVWRLADAHLRPRGSQREDRRALVAQEQIRVLKDRIRELEAAIGSDAPRTVTLPRLQVEVLEGAAAGKTQQQIATERGVRPSGISQLLARAALNLGAQDVPTAIVLVRQGAVRLKARDGRRAA